jgi:sialate O-acetylesterase
MKSFCKYFFSGLLFLFLNPNLKVSASLRLPKIFGNNMVLQRNTNIAIWGWSTPKTSVIIEFAGHSTFASVNEKGKWMARLPEEVAGGPFIMKIFGEEKDSVIFKNVMVGEVWLASGQSNMTWAMGWGIDNKDEEISMANNPNIRIFTVADDLNNYPQDDITGGKWEECNPANAPGFSATAYFFAAELQKKLNVPVGIIHSSWGGTNIESWMSIESIKTFPVFSSSVPEIIKKTGNFENGYETFNADNIKRDSILKSSTVGIDLKIYNPGYNDSDWATMNLPCKWSDYGIQNFYGYCWFRKTIEIPASAKGKDLILSLGEICCDNICYFNGKKVDVAEKNSITSYKIPGKLVKTGKNLICLQILGRWGVGGFKSPENLIYIEDSLKSFHLSLATGWKYNNKIEPQTPEWNEYYNYPTFIYNAKIAPLVPYSIKGILWYQGENNTSRAEQYKSLFPALINDWRMRWSEGYLPFIFAQLANYGSRSEVPAESNVAELREAQTEGLKYLNTAMVVNIDLGRADDDVHFRNKKECGRRFALAAMGLVYFQDIEFSGPAYQSMSIEENKIRIRFLHADSGLKTSSNEPVKSICIAGKDGVFVWAEAKVEGNTLVVWNNKIEHPVAVRFGWADNPECNLYNTEGLPAAPFRTSP